MNLRKQIKKIKKHKKKSKEEELNLIKKIN
jgi:hypothetical protein